MDHLLNKRSTLRLFVCPLLIGALACGSSDKSESDDPEQPEAKVHGLTAEQAAAIAAVVGETQITVGDVAEALSEQSPYLRARYTNLEQKREFLDHLVQLELLVQEGERRGFRQRPEVENARRRALVAELLRDEIDARITPGDISDRDIQAYYEAHPEEFDQPEQVRASHILVRDRSRADSLLAQATQAEGIAAFRRLALEHSEDPQTRSRGGDLRFFSRPPSEGADPTEPYQGPPVEVARAAFELDSNGAVSPRLVRSQEGFHIVARTAYRPAMRRTLEEVSRVIRSRLHRDRRDEALTALVGRLRAQANVETNPEVLSKVRTSGPRGSAGAGDAPAAEGAL